jgi:peroxiredoxin
MGLVVAVCFAASARSRAAGEPEGGGPAAAGFARADATSDPLLILLRAPAIRRELALDRHQVEALERTVGAIEPPLWRLRDAQFLSVENSQAAWSLIDRIDSGLEAILDRKQHARFAQLLLQARGLDALLTPQAIELLGLSADQQRQISAILGDTRKRLPSIPQAPASKTNQPAGSPAERLLAACREKVAAVLSDEQKRQWQQGRGAPYDFSRIPRRFARAPEMRPVDAWINSPPLTLASLQGKVVALHFFTFGCSNCVHNQPAYKDWHERFSRRGVVVLGIHTPETAEEHRVDSVRRALRSQGIAYPVAVDNAKENWNAWANHTWPAVYLIDTEGYVRYWWYGELNWQGAQGEAYFRKRIAELLAETSPNASGPPGDRRELAE